MYCGKREGHRNASARAGPWRGIGESRVQRESMRLPMLEKRLLGARSAVEGRVRCLRLSYGRGGGGR
jgi:hypothetical protein